MGHKTPEAAREYQRKWYQEHKEEHKTKVKAYAKRNPHIMAKIQRKVNYGITQDEYESMLRLQDNRCAICGVSFEGTTPNVDHDHQTKRIRGLLCTNCNLGLGRFGDSISLLESAIEYLK